MRSRSCCTHKRFSSLLVITITTIALTAVGSATAAGTYTLIVEIIFRFQGIGFQLVEAIQNRDYALAQSLALLFTAVVIFSNFLADIGHQLLDPRVRERSRGR